MKKRPFRFGISFGGTPTRAELVSAIRRAEESGFDVVSTADHISSRSKPQTQGCNAGCTGIAAHRIK